MSLIGSLEDLGLGDILQIISLSQKSGVLTIRSHRGEGRIVVSGGVVRGAAVKGGPQDLRSVLVGGGFVEAADFDCAAELAEARGAALEETLSDTTALPLERIEALRREAVEQAVVSMCRWDAGEFSFDVQPQGELEAAGILLSSGLNAQYLAMEGMRVRDESHRPEEAEPIADAAAPAEAPATANDVIAHASLDGVEGSEPELHEAELLDDAEPAEGIEEVIASPAPLGAETAREEPSPEPREVRGAAPVVVIDPDLAALEWAKHELGRHGARVHIFQRADLGLARIRQYLARAVSPVVLLNPEAPFDPLGGIRDAVDFVRRMRSTAPQTRVLWFRSEDAAGPPPRLPNVPCASRPSSVRLRGRRAGETPPSWGAGAVTQILGEEALESMRIDLVVPAGEAGPDGPPAAEALEAVDPRALDRLKRVTRLLAEGASRGEILPLVLRFAGDLFERVAVFLVRDGVVEGLAQLGLERAGGPDDDRLRAIRFDAEDCGWLRTALARRGAVHAGPTDAGDRHLAGMLGDRPPAEAYVAPIESGGQVVAVLYADNLPGDAPLGDTSALEVVLHHAGLALDRAALERALAEA